MDVIQWFEGLSNLGLSNLGTIAEAIIVLGGGAKFLHALISGFKKQPASESLEKSFA